MKDMFGAIPKLLKKATPRQSISEENVSDIDEVKTFAHENTGSSRGSRSVSPSLHDQPRSSSMTFGSFGFSNGFGAASSNTPGFGFSAPMANSTTNNSFNVVAMGNKFGGSEQSLDKAKNTPVKSGSSSGEALGSPDPEKQAQAWVRSYDEMMADEDGVQLFSTFLAEERLLHLLEFRHTVIGMKLGAEDKRREVLKAIYRRYIKHTTDAKSKRIDFIPDEVRKEIAEKNSRKCTDTDMFDSALDIVEDRLKRCHINFLKSQVFIDFLNSEGHVQLHQNQPDHEPVQDCVKPKPTPRPVKPTKSLPTLPENCEVLNQGEDKIIVNKNVSFPSAQVPKVPFAAPGVSLKNLPGTQYIPHLDQQQRSGSSTLKKSKVASSSGGHFYDLGVLGPSSGTPVPTSGSGSGFGRKSYNAMASTFNNVTRQATAYNSTATDTSDALSAFSTEDQRRRDRREFKMAKQSAQQNGPQQKMMHLPSSASHQQQQQQQQQQEQPDYVLAEKYHERFAHKLIGKMLKVHEDRRFKEMLKRQHEDRKSNASLSILEDEDDNDESILDEHVETCAAFNKPTSDKRRAHGVHPVGGGGKSGPRNRGDGLSIVCQPRSMDQPRPAYNADSQNNESVYGIPANSKARLYNMNSLPRHQPHHFRHHQQQQQQQYPQHGHYPAPTSRSHQPPQFGGQSQNNMGSTVSLSKKMEAMNFGSNGNWTNSLGRSYANPNAISNPSVNSWVAQQNTQYQQQQRQVAKIIEAKVEVTRGKGDEAEKYKLKIPNRNPVGGGGVTLLDLKRALPLKNYKYFVKRVDPVDGTGVFEEQYDDNAVLPLWDGRNIHARCLPNN